MTMPGGSLVRPLRSLGIVLQQRVRTPDCAGKSAPNRTLCSNHIRVNIDER